MSCFVVTVLLLLALVIVLVLRCRKKRGAKESKAEDENPVYGIYYFADGERIDESRSEVVDHNENYGS